MEVPTKTFPLHEKLLLVFSNVIGLSLMLVLGKGLKKAHSTNTSQLCILLFHWAFLRLCFYHFDFSVLISKFQCGKANKNQTQNAR